MNKLFALAITALASSTAIAGEIADNATIGWQEAQCAAISRLDETGYNGAAGDQLLKLAKPRLSRYFTQYKANAISKEEWGKIGGNLEASAKISDDADHFVYAVLADYTRKLQQLKSESNFTPDSVNGQFFYSMAWVNGGCAAMLALDK